MLDKVTDDNFFEKVIKSNKPVVVDFFSSTCEPCKELMPTMEKLAEEYKEKVKFAALRVESNQKIPLNFGIMSVPTVLFFKEGKILEQLIGVATESKIKEVIDNKLIS